MLLEIYPMTRSNRTYRAMTLCQGVDFTFLDGVQGLASWLGVQQFSAK